LEGKITAEEKNGNHYYKCPHCACVFFAKSDLQKHIGCFGEDRQAHADSYSKTHGRIEHGYGEE